jgi:hypothetical protein
LFVRVFFLYCLLDLVSNQGATRSDCVLDVLAAGSGDWSARTVRLSEVRQLSSLRVPLPAEGAGKRLDAVMAKVPKRSACVCLLLNCLLL